MQTCQRTWALLGALLTVYLLGYLPVSSFAQSVSGELVLLNWPEYMDPDLVHAFEQRFNVKVKEIHFESDDLRDDMLLESDAKGYDLAVVNDSSIEIYRRQGWLSRVGEDKVPNLRHIDDRWRDAVVGARKYAVPYFWGTLGIGYRSDLVDHAPSRWMDLFEPAESVRGKIGMVRTSSDLIGMALKALGHSANSTDSGAIEEAEELLLAQKPYVKTYTYIDLDEESALVTGDLVMTMMYSGDALMLQEYNQNIAFVIPEEGGNLWVDYLAVMESSANKELAWAFINFLNEPENAAQLAQFVYYATPNKSAEKLLPAEFLADEVIYPDEEAVARSEFYAPMPSRAIRKRNLVFARLMR